MPAKFHQVTPAIWDQRMRKLRPASQLVRLYILTCRDRVSEGLFILPPGIIAHDTGLSEDDVTTALDELEQLELIHYDHDAEVVLDTIALRYSPLKNGKTVDKATGREITKQDNRIPNAVRLFAQIPPSPLRAQFFQLAQRHSPDFASAIAEHVDEFALAGDRHDSEAPAKPLQRASEAPSEPLAHTPEAPRRAGQLRGEAVEEPKSIAPHVSTVSGICPVMASSPARSWPTELPRRGR